MSNGFRRWLIVAIFAFIFAVAALSAERGIFQ
jgi:hypothetical protein